MTRSLLVLLPIALFAADTPAKVTFHKDVEPILQKRCQSCHRPGEVGPMSFLTYSSTRPYAKAIRQAVLSKQMPPWFAAGQPGKFRNDPSLSKSEIDTLVAWADTGSTEGDPASAPAPIKFLDGWNIGVPDMVFEMPEPYTVPASGTIEYQHIVVPTNFKEDRWVRAVEIRPGNRAVVHHVIAFSRPPGSRWLADAKPGVPTVRSGLPLTALKTEENPEFLLSYTPGRPPVELEPGQARLIKAGSDIVFQLHYTANGREQTDRSKVGLIFSKEPPKERVATLIMANARFAIPPGAPNHRVDMSYPVAEPARLLRVIPHMHLRGKAFELRLTGGDDSPEPLLRVPRYDFRWQNAYFLSEPIYLKPGMKVDCIGWFDNSPNNKFNPDPTAEVRWGDQSWEEMLVNYVDVAVAPNAEPKRVLARPAGAGVPAQTIRDQFLGSWKLIEFTRKNKAGVVDHPYGPHATGRITYDRAGRMSAQLMNPDRPKSKNPPGVSQIADFTESDMRAVLNGYISYYGTFDIDDTTKTVHHRVESCLYPSWVGTTLNRTYEFSGKRLTLKADGPTGQLTLIWERLPD